MTKRTPPEITYSIDSSALIHGWVRSYPIRNFEPFWDEIDELIRQGRLKASMEVFHEIAKKDDDLHAWCKERKESLFVEIDDDQQDAVSEIMEKYPRLVNTSNGKSGGDPFVIGLAMAGRPRYTVVSEENNGGPKNPKIPDVCVAEDIRCIRLVDLIREQDWRF